MDQKKKKLTPKERNKVIAEWIVIAAIVVVIVIAVLITWLVFIPQLFPGTSVETPGFPEPKGCPVSQAPTGLNASQTATIQPNIDLSWNAVLTTTTPDEQILGYNIYSSRQSGITESNKRLATFTVVPQQRLFTLASGSVRADTTYYFVVTTVDTCGESPISSEISFTTLPE